ncbi:MAG: hypothetical protein ACYDH4_10870, partial [Candidatus Cryosericum sp.]
MTVGELRAALEGLDENLPVKAVKVHHDYEISSWTFEDGDEAVLLHLEVENMGSLDEHSGTLL